MKVGTFVTQGTTMFFWSETNSHAEASNFANTQCLLLDLQIIKQVTFNFNFQYLITLWVQYAMAKITFYYKSTSLFYYICNGTGLNWNQYQKLSGQ